MGAKWLTRQGSNLEPSGPEPDVLPIRPRVNERPTCNLAVGPVNLVCASSDRFPQRRGRTRIAAGRGDRGRGSGELVHHQAVGGQGRVQLLEPVLLPQLDAV